MAGAGVATGFHEYRHDVELETDGRLIGGVRDRDGNGEFAAFVRDAEFGLAIGEWREICLIESDNLRISEFEAGLGGDIAGDAVGGRGLDDEALSGFGAGERDVCGVALEID